MTNEVDQIDSEDEGLAYGYSADSAETTTQPVTETVEDTDDSDIVDDDPKDADTDDEGEPEEGIQDDPKPAQKPDDSDAVIKRLDGRMRNMQGEINRLNKQLAEQSTAAAAAVEKQGGDAPSASQVKDAMEDGESLAALRDEFPEWAEALDEQSEAIERRVLGKIPATDISGLATREEIDHFKKTMPILIKHPTFEDDVRTQEFSDWVSAQPDNVQSLAASDKPRDAILLMDKFYERDTAPRKSPQQQRLRESVAPSTGANRPRSRASTEEDGLMIGYKNSM